ncbi:MAG: cytosine permease [Pseudohongiellaceae bacterium]
MENKKNYVKWYSLASIWVGGMVCVPALLVASTLIASLSFHVSLLAGLLGFSFVVFFMALISIAAVEQRKNTVILASSSFGEHGATIVVGLVIGLSSLGWFGVQTNIAGASFSNVVSEMNGPDIPIWLSSVFWGVVMVLTAVFGFKYLKWLNYIAVPAMVVLLVYSMVITFQEHSLREVLDFKPTSSIPLFQGIGLVIGSITVAGVISADYNRFAITRKDAIFGVMIGIIPPGMCLLAIGAILAITQGTYDIVEIFSSLGYPLLAMSVLILATWTTNVINIYSAGLAFTNLLKLNETARSKITLFVGIVGITLAAIGVLNYFINFITILTITVTPIAGVLISDYFFSKSYSESPPPINWIGLISWASGATLMLIMSSPLKSILGIVMSGVVYYLLKKIIK